ncbi:hypothetical protein Tco_1150122, partial [Tanacetum coccineum]
TSSGIPLHCDFWGCYTPPSPNYVHGPEHPLSPDYVPGHKHPPSPDYVPGPEYPKYLVPSDDEVPIEDQPLPADALPTSPSPRYVVDSDPLEEDPEEDPTNGGDDVDDDNDDDDEQEDEDTEAFETDKSAPTPPVPSPRLRKARISVRPQTQMSAATKALIAAVTAALPSSPPPSPLTPLSSPLPQIPSLPLPLPSPPTHTSPNYAKAPLGYKAAMIRSSVTSPLPLPAPSSPLLLPAIDRRKDVLEADVPPRKRLCLNALAHRFKVGESSAVTAARLPRLDVTHATDYSLVDTMDATLRCPMYRERVTDLATTLARDTHEMYVRFEDAQDDRALQRSRVNMLFRDRRYHLHTSKFLESEARYAQQAWSQAMDCNRAVHAELLAYRVEVRALHE